MQRADQVGRENEAALEHSEEHQRSFRVVAFDLLAELTDSLCDAVAVDVDSRFLGGLVHGSLLL